ncbi:MAG TPA: CCA tRNA nucleotidyltransferase [Actinomycetota bacterium]|nr:CCA tRNA nucleotidyltransferase [Actinomycetota bacterium]
MHDGDTTERARAALAAVLKPGSPVLELAGQFEKRGRELYLVGGWVRDALLGRAHEDLDFATNAEPEETRAIVASLATNVWLQGIEFGTVGAELDGMNVEITTFRTEKYQPSSRHPNVKFAADVETDLARRDFTMNAIAIKLPELAAIDPFDGRADLDQKLIRTPIDPRDSFSDDPLRMLRAFRFASQLGFHVDDSALEAIGELRAQIETVSAERVRDELVSLLLGAAPGRALDLADKTGLLELVLPEVSALKLEQDPVHKHKDVFHLTLAVMERTPRERDLRLAALLHDIGKPRTRRISKEGVSFHHHEVVGADMAEARLRALRFPNEVAVKVSEMIRLHHRFHTYRLGWTDSAVRRYVRDAGALLGDLNRLVRADCTTRDTAKARRLAARMDELEERIADLAEKEALDRIRPELDGNEVMKLLGIGPGPLVGEALAYLLEIRLDEGEIGKDAARERLAEWARAKGLTPTD